MLIKMSLIKIMNEQWKRQVFLKWHKVKWNETVAGMYEIQIYNEMKMVRQDAAYTLTVAQVPSQKKLYCLQWLFYENWNIEGSSIFKKWYTQRCGRGAESSITLFFFCTLPFFILSVSNIYYVEKRSCSHFEGTQNKTKPKKKN